MIRACLLFWCLCLLAIGQEAAFATKHLTKSDIPYYPEEVAKADPYIQERCKLDIHYPEKKKGSDVLVWFHGGGLTGGDKAIPKELKNKGVVVISANYRLHPKVKAPVYIKDAAAAVAWAFKHAEGYGGDASRIFVSGHSAGGYLASMVGLDKRWLAAHKIDADKIAGLIPLSGHTITHFTIRKEMGIDGKQPLINDLAPLHHVRSDAPPLLLITGDREKEMLGRYEENAYLMRMMKVNGHQQTKLIELKGFGHGIVQPSIPLILKEMERIQHPKNR